MKFSELSRRTATTRIDYDGEEVELTYRPHVITPELLARLDDLSGVDAVVDQVVTLIAEWDVTMDDGSRMDVTDANARRLPLSFLKCAVSGVISAMRGPGTVEKKL